MDNIDFYAYRPERTDVQIAEVDSIMSVNFTGYTRLKRGEFENITDYIVPIENQSGPVYIMGFLKDGTSHLFNAIVKEVRCGNIYLSDNTKIIFS